MLGVGDFYYERGVQAIQVCMREQARTGGLMLLSDLVTEIRVLRGTKSQPISKNDIEDEMERERRQQHKIYANSVFHSFIH